MCAVWWDGEDWCSVPVPCRLQTEAALITPGRWRHTRHSTLRAPDQQLSQLQCTSIYSPGCQMYVMTENYFEEADCDLREDTQEQF